MYKYGIFVDDIVKESFFYHENEKVVEFVLFNMKRVLVFTGIGRNDETVYNDAYAILCDGFYNDLPLSDFVNITNLSDDDSLLDLFENHKPNKQILAKIILRHDSLDNNDFAVSLRKFINNDKSLTDRQLYYVIDTNAKRSLLKTVINNDIQLNLAIEYYKETIANNRKSVSDSILSSNRSVDKLDVSKVELIKTENYKYYDYPFEEFNPIQSKTFDFIEKDTNIVIAAATSAGKTVCAELLIDYTLHKLNKKVLYLSPLKSLTSEKYEDWQKRFSQFNIEIMTGDYVITKKKQKALKKADIICITSEMLDSRTRKINSEKNTWMLDIGLVVMDEAHIIGADSRGHAAEVGLMRFSKINKDARIMMLSATIPNVYDFINWLTVLNGKKTDYIISDWRPVTLEEKFIEVGAQRFNFRRRQKMEMETVMDLVKSKPDEKFLVFVQSKRIGKRLVDKLASAGVFSTFHNADLVKEERDMIEDSFRNGDLRVLISTSTLAWGVNLPARNVIISSVIRGFEEVNVLDLLQMKGRAGRFGIDDKGFVYILIPDGELREWKNKFNNPPDVYSTLLNPYVLAFHILADIFTGDIRTMEDVNNWYDRSLAKIQGKMISKNIVDDIVKDLKEMKMVRYRFHEFHITGLGIVSAVMYYTPFDVYAWHKNFSHLFKTFKADTVMDENILLAWALTAIPMFKSDYIYMDDRIKDTYDSINSQLRLFGLYNGDDIPGYMPYLYVLLNFLDGVDIKQMFPEVRAMAVGVINDLKRIVTAIQMIDYGYSKWSDKYDIGNKFWDNLYYRISYGVDEELINLVQIKGIGRARAELLYSYGIETPFDIIESEEIVYDIFGEKVGKKIIKNVHKFLEENAKKGV